MLRWWPHTDDARVASYRLRCLQVVDKLAHEGLDASLYRPTSGERPTVLVLSKRYDAATLDHALALRRQWGTRVVLDLCDNHFHVDNGDARLVERAQALRQAVDSADLVIASSQALADVIRSECPRQHRLEVIADATELPFDPGLPTRVRHPRDELALWSLTRGLQRSGIPRARRLLWFGNHGSPGADGGMTDLLHIGTELARAHRAQPLSLTVISNNQDKFVRLTRGWALPLHYLPWRAGTFSRAARLHGTAVIPVSLNPFTRCKTNNRLATAFVHDLNVIADAIPSYQPFAACTVLDDWPRGLGSYLGDAARRAADLTAGQQIVRAGYSLDVLSQRWRKVIAAPLEESREKLL